MSFDFTQINEKNCPARWAQIINYLKNNDENQLNNLKENYRKTLDYVYNILNEKDEEDEKEKENIIEISPIKIDNKVKILK